MSSPIRHHAGQSDRVDVFAHLTSEKKSTVVARWIWNKIQSGEYRVGDKLPPERELCRLLGVSRYPIREAIGVLAAQGVLRAQTGDGTYVARLPQDRESVYLADLMAEDDSPLESLELRRIIELGIVELALQRGVEVQLPAMRKALDAMRRAFDQGDRKAYIDADDEFHLSIARATQNETVERHLAMLLRVRRSNLWRTIKDNLLTSEAHYQNMMRAHEAIYRYIAERDVEGARAAMSHHFDEIVQELNRSGV